MCEKKSNQLCLGKQDARMFFGFFFCYCKISLFVSCWLHSLQLLSSFMACLPWNELLLHLHTRILTLTHCWVIVWFGSQSLTVTVCINFNLLYTGLANPGSPTSLVNLWRTSLIVHADHKPTQFHSSRISNQHLFYTIIISKLLIAFGLVERQFLRI